MNWFFQRKLTVAQKRCKSELKVHGVFHIAITIGEKNRMQYNEDKYTLIMISSSILLLFDFSNALSSKTSKFFVTVLKKIP